MAEEEFLPPIHDFNLLSRYHARCAIQLGQLHKLFMECSDLDQLRVLSKRSEMLRLKFYYAYGALDMSCEIARFLYANPRREEPRAYN